MTMMFACFEREYASSPLSLRVEPAGGSFPVRPVGGRGHWIDVVVAVAGGDGARIDSRPNGVDFAVAEGVCSKVVSTKLNLEEKEAFFRILSR